MKIKSKDLILIAEADKQLRVVRHEIKKLGKTIKKIMKTRGGQFPTAWSTPDLIVLTAASIKTTDKAFDWTPFHKIPNVKDFTMKIEHLDKISAESCSQLQRDESLEISYYQNKRSQRYAKHMIRRLRNTKSDILY
jgi:hypothetical protein